jgi:hypothetical protein
VTHRRGLDLAKRVCAVCDGAEWEPKFINLTNAHPSIAIDKAKSLHLDFARTTYILNDGHGSLNFTQALFLKAPV